MKVVHINATSCSGSTGRLIVQLQRTIRSMGDECRIYAAETQKETECFYIGSMVDHKVHAFLSRLLGIQGYFSRFATAKLVRDLKRYKPDIVHLHNLHSNYLYFPALFQFLQNEKIATFITLHDCFLFTGKCSHYLKENCFKWQNECNHCPRLKTDNVSWFFDRTKKMFRDKKRWFASLDNLTVVGVSKWITDETRKSFLSCACKIDTIYNWVDLDCFAPREETELRLSIGLAGKIVVLGVNASWSNAKGLEDFIALSKELDSRYAVVLIGCVSKEKLADTNIVHIPLIRDAKLLARYYNMADVFVNASVQETFGLTTAEALACGTPCVVYNKTACPELIGPGCGYVVENYDELKMQICSIAGGGKAQFAESCRAYAEEMFCMEANVQKYIELYRNNTQE